MTIISDQLQKLPIIQKIVKEDEENIKKIGRELPQVEKNEKVIGHATILEQATYAAHVSSLKMISEEENIEELNLLLELLWHSIRSRIPEAKSTVGIRKDFQIIEIKEKNNNRIDIVGLGFIIGQV